MATVSVLAGSEAKRSVSVAVLILSKESSLDLEGSAYTADQLVISCYRSGARFTKSLTIYRAIILSSS